MSSIVDTLQKSQHSTWIEIRVDRLFANLKVLQSHAPEAKVLAVVKANAYGHGLLEIAKALNGSVAYLGVSSLREALELKEHRIETPVFLFGRVFNYELPAALMEGITLSVSSLEEAQEISEASLSLNRKTSIHIKVDTGMGRLGIPFRDALSVIEKISAFPALHLEGLYTHFPTAEREDGFSTRQINDFSLLIEALSKKEIQFKYRHATNSAGTLKVKHPALNMIRPGLMLYGIYPDESLKPQAAVLPILSLKSRIICVKRLKTGESAGYGREFVAEKPVTVAILPVGYSAGYPFRASSRAEVLYQGKRFPLAGRVSMDYITINFGNVTPKAGDEVTLIGQDYGDAIRAEELAAHAGTIPYEIVTRILPSIPRLYL